MNWKNSFHPYALTTILCWSLPYVLTRLTAPWFSAFSLGFLRTGIAAVVLAACAFPLKLKLPAKKDWGWFLLSGAVGFFIYIIAFNKGCEALPAATSSVIIATAPVMTALLARVFYKEALRGYQWCAIAMEFVGVVVLTVLTGGLSVNLGVFWLVGAAVVLSLYNLLQRRLTRTYSALQASTFSIFIGAVLLSIFLPGVVRETSRAPGIQLVYVLLMGVLSTAVAYITWAKAFAKAEKTSQVSNYMFLTPFLTGVLGFVMIGEVPDSATLIGGAIILAGVVLFNFGSRFFAAAKKEQEVS